MTIFLNTTLIFMLIFSLIKIKMEKIKNKKVEEILFKERILNKSIAYNSKTFILVYNEKNIIEDMNRVAERIFCIKKENAIGKSLEAIVSTNCFNEFKKNEGKKTDFNIIIKKQHGTILNDIVLSLNSHVVINIDKPKENVVVLSGLELPKNKEVKQMEQYVKDNKIGFWHYDFEQDLIVLNDEAKKIVSHEDKVQLNFKDFFLKKVHPQDRNKLLNTINSLKRGELTSFSLEIRFLVKSHSYEWIQLSTSEMGKIDSQYEWIRLSSTETKQFKNEIIFISGTCKNISFEKRREEETFDLAYKDEITKLPNRRYLMEQLHEEFVANNKGTVIFFDIDNFKNINDLKGHTVGDEVLKLIATRIGLMVEEREVFARWGGDEFVYLMKGIIDETEVKNKVENIILAFKQSFEIDGTSFDTSTSIGVAMYPLHGDNYEELLKNVDIAMYSIKDSGKNNYRFFDSALTKKIKERLLIEEKLKKAISKNEFYLVYQPIIHKNIDYPYEFEALIRWENEELGLVSPSKFIPIAENTSYASEIGLYVIGEVIKTIKEFEKKNIEMVVSINISPVQIQERGFAREFLDTLRKNKVRTSKIKIEITESAVIKNYGCLIENLTILRKAGVKIALDDFGTGYSSLSYLRKLPVDVLKIDKSFIDEIMENGETHILKATLNLAEDLGLETVAEGVETKEQVEFLNKEECDYIQGYYFYKPMKKDLLFELFSTNDKKISRNVVNQFSNKRVISPIQAV